MNGEDEERKNKNELNTINSFIIELLNLIVDEKEMETEEEKYFCDKLNSDTGIYYIMCKLYIKFNLIKIRHLFNSCTSDCLTKSFGSSAIIHDIKTNKITITDCLFNEKKINLQHLKLYRKFLKELKKDENKLLYYKLILNTL